MKTILLVLLSVQILLAQDPWVTHYTAFTSAEINDLDGWVVKKAFKGNTFSKCDKISLVGGYGAFGKGATALKQLTLPPHYKLKINVQLWKIDSWDNEIMFVLVDGFIWQAKWHYSEGANLCGAANDWKEAFYNIEFEVPHNSPTVSIVLTSNLDEDALNESWAFRDFKLSFQRCHPECAVCGDNKPDNCFFWTNVATNWNKQISLEGWTLDGEGKAEANECAGVQLFGGFGKLGRKANLWKRFTNLPPHFQVKVKVQMWKIDSWDNELFLMEIDDQEKFRQAFAYNEGVDLCGVDTGAKQGEGWAEKIVNIEINVPHKFPEVKVLMKSTLDEPPENESWGVRDFQLFAAQCFKGCTGCTGPAKSDCTSCGQGFDLVNGECKEGIKWMTLNRFFFNDEQDFQGLQDWIPSNVFQNQNPFSTCGQKKLFGGYQRFGVRAKAERNFNLPKHSRLRIQFQFWKIDSWDDEKFQVFVDGKVVFERSFGFSTPGQAKICGAPQSTWMTYFFNVDVIIEHTNPTANIVLSSTLDQGADDESWGFREFQLLYELKEDCVELYTECGFKGTKYEICRDTPSLAREKISQVKSIKIPPGVIVQGFDEEVYKGKTVKFSQSQDCLEEIQFSFIQKKFEIIQADDSVLAANLRRIRFD
ncbi:unnamed protein product [Paramecium primaurelia]|uniref:Uncharacterized protein n=1 Tax=Paramecium primaurelia TaxID=5886 RepID=A0A8S1PTE8_PARPR|nr:unnamed protein product [Paramecium primaurelia]